MEILLQLIYHQASKTITSIDLYIKGKTITPY